MGRRLHKGGAVSAHLGAEALLDCVLMSHSSALQLQDCSIELTVGRRYGLIGQNGSGKTNFLQALAHREVCTRLGRLAALQTLCSAALPPLCGLSSLCAFDSRGNKTPNVGGA